MSRKSYYVLSSLVCLMPILLGVLHYSALPENMPIHWDVSGSPDNFAAKPFVVYGIPAAMTVFNIILNALTDCRRGWPRLYARNSRLGTSRDDDNTLHNDNILRSWIRN